MAPALLRIRLGVARLISDEPTAGVDSGTEAVRHETHLDVVMGMSTRQQQGVPLPHLFLTSHTCINEGGGRPVEEGGTI